MKGVLTECTNEENMFQTNFYELDIDEKILRVYEEDSLEMKEQIYLSSRF